MTTGSDGRSSYGSGGAGGKLRKRPFRRSAQATPYDRPPTALRNNNPSLLTKLVDPASKLLYAGAHRLFGVFRNRLPSLSLQGSPEVNEEPQDVLQEARLNSTQEGGNSASISATTSMSELEAMLKEKTFTRSEILHLTELLNSRTVNSTSDDIVERNRPKPYNSPSSLVRLKTPPIVSSRVLEEDIASPADLAKAYMGSRSIKVEPSGPGSSSQSPRPDLKLLNDASGILTTPVVPETANSFRGPENGFLTPRPRGRSAMYTMGRTPYSRVPSPFSPKGIMSDYRRDAALTSFQSARGHEGKMVLKRRSATLDDDIGSGGPLRRIRQKANLLPQRSSQSRDTQNLIVTNGPDSKVNKGVEENGGTSLRGSSFASVPTKSTQMATKILEHLERLSPKEKSSRSMREISVSPRKLTSDMLHGKALRSLEKIDSPKYFPSLDVTQKSDSEVQNNRELTSQKKGKEKVEENVLRKFPAPRNMLTSVNGDLTVPLKDNASIVTSDSTSKLAIVEPPQKKHAFQMSVPEDLLEVDDDIHVNGHVSFTLVEPEKAEPFLVTKKHAFTKEFQTPSLPEVPKTPLQVEATSEFPKAAKIPEQAKTKEGDNATSSSKSDVGLFGGSVSEPKLGFMLPTSPPSTTTTQTGVLPQSTLQTDKLSPEKNPGNVISLFGTGAEKASPLKFSSNGPSEFKPDASLDPKTVDSTSVFSAITKDDQIKPPFFNNENGNDQKATNIFGKSESSTSAVPIATSTSGFFSFGTSTTASPNNTSASTPPLIPSFPTSGFFNNTSSNVTSVTTTTTTTTALSPATQTAASNSVFSTSVSPPVFSFGSAATKFVSTSTNPDTNEKEPKSNMAASSPFATSSFLATTAGSSPFGFNSSPAATSTTNNQFPGSATTNVASTSTVETGKPNTDEKEPKSNVSASSPFASTPFLATTTTTGSSLFGFNSSPVTTSTTSNQLPGPFNVSSGSQTVSFQFGSSAPSFASASTSGSSIFASPTLETKTVDSTSGSAASIFGSAPSPWPSPQTSGFGSTFSSPSPVFSFGSSNPAPPTGSSSMFSFSAAGATNSSFGTTSSLFGNPTPVFGAATTTPTPTPNPNDNMSMEDTMAEDSMQTPSPVSPFGQSPGFMFGSATPNPPQPTVPFQFGGQTPTQNPFQSSTVDFNAGGSFSLGTGGDKSGRRIVRVKNKNRRK